MFNLGRHINRAGMPSEKGHNAGLFCTARTGFEPVVSALRGQRHGQQDACAVVNITEIITLFQPSEKLSNPYSATAETIAPTLRIGAGITPIISAPFCADDWR